MENGNTQKLAEKIALLLRENDKGSGDFSSLQFSIEKISERLKNIENRLNTQNSDEIYPSSFILHPSNRASQERFDIAEIVADEIIDNLQNEKACPYEPTGKPCDHCAMCSSRGF